MRILFATDFSSYSDTARLLLHGLDLLAGTRIRVLNVVEPITTVSLFAPGTLVAISEANERDARQLVERTATQLGSPGVIVDTAVMSDRAADAIIEQARRFEPDLIVVGSRGRGAIATTVLGSVSAEVIDRAPCPVLVARRTTFRRVIVADDGSPDAASGADAVFGLRFFGRPTVHVVSVVDLPFPLVLADPTGTATALEAYRDWEAAKPAARAKSADLARDRAVALQRHGLIATWEQREGDAAYELIAAAAEQRADCIVVGSRGQTGLARFIVGSVARGVLFHAPCSVLVAHDKARLPKSAERADGKLAAVAR